MRPCDGVDQEHLAGLQAALLDDARGIDVEHAELARHHDEAVEVTDVLRGAKAVAIERRADELAVGEDERGRAVPRLDEAPVVLVEAPSSRSDMSGRRGPRLGHEHHHHVRQRATARDEEVDDVVERRRVGAARADDRLEVVDVLVEELAREERLARAHPVLVAAQRVDLAVVRDEPVRVRALPGRERVGREARVHQREPRTARGRRGRGRSRRPARGASGPCRRRCATSTTRRRSRRRELWRERRRRACGSCRACARTSCSVAHAPDEELPHRPASTSRATGPSARRVDGHVAPAEHALPVVHHRCLEDRLLAAAARRDRARRSTSRPRSRRARGSLMPRDAESATRRARAGSARGRPRRRRCRDRSRRRRDASGWRGSRAPGSLRRVWRFD